MDGLRIFWQLLQALFITHCSKLHSVYYINQVTVCQEQSKILNNMPAHLSTVVASLCTSSAVSTKRGQLLGLIAELGHQLPVC